MTNDKQFLRKGMPLEQEDALESVSGGVPEFIKPAFDPSDDPVRCPVCGVELTISGESARCLHCGRSFQIDELL